MGKKQSSLKVQRSLLKMYVSCITKIDDYPLSINNTLSTVLYEMYVLCCEYFYIKYGYFLLNYESFAVNKCEYINKISFALLHYVQDHEPH
jgi:hypothetical protein